MAGQSAGAGAGRYRYVTALSDLRRRPTSTATWILFSRRLRATTALDDRRLTTRTPRRPTTTPPNTLLVGKKPENTTKTKVKIKFTRPRPVRRSVQGGREEVQAVHVTAELKNLKVGKHKVLIVATDAAGNRTRRP